jgi:hypothetical protein
VGSIPRSTPHPPSTDASIDAGEVIVRATVDHAPSEATVIVHDVNGEIVRVLATSNGEARASVLRRIIHRETWSFVRQGFVDFARMPRADRLRFPIPPSFALAVRAEITATADPLRPAISLSASARGLDAIAVQVRGGARDWHILVPPDRADLTLPALPSGVSPLESIPNGRLAVGAAAIEIDTVDGYRALRRRFGVRIADAPTRLDEPLAPDERVRATYDHFEASPLELGSRAWASAPTRFRRFARSGQSAIRASISFASSSVSVTDAVGFARTLETAR